MFWLISKLFWIVAQPVAVIFVAILAGFALGFTRHKWLARSFLGFGLIAIIVIGFTNIGALIMAPLEAKYPHPATLPENLAGVIVLGGGTLNDVSAATGRYALGGAGDRFVETLRLALADPKLKIVVSGGVGNIAGVGESDAAGVKRLLDAFGVNEDRVTYESRSRNTCENAQFSAELLHPRPNQTWLLITSAAHMVRSVPLFERAGFHLVPWPVDYRTTGDTSWKFIPDGADGQIAMTTSALREWIGLLAYWVTGKIPNPFAN